MRTPYLHLDLDLVAERYSELASALPGTTIHYAVKANPHPDVLDTLAAAGSSFDVASPAEVTAALATGAGAASVVYSNPVKRRDDVAWSFEHGVGLFVVDSADEIAKVAAEAPGSAVLCRLLTSGDGSDWPLSRKYGVPAQDCVQLLESAARLGLEPAGVGFHVGSQQRDPNAWDEPIQASAWVFGQLRRLGHRPRLLDLGGGFPAGLEGGHADLAAYGAVIGRSLRVAFGGDLPSTLVEPGRGLVADAGTLVSTVIGVCWRGGRRWVYLDAGVFTGLVETIDEAIRYRLTTTADGGVTGPVVLAGPTCDSADVLYEHAPVELPLDLAEGDTVTLHAAGAYTTCYSTVGFNGFEPLGTVVRGNAGTDVQAVA